MFQNCKQPLLFSVFLIQKRCGKTQKKTFKLNYLICNGNETMKLKTRKEKKRGITMPHNLKKSSHPLANVLNLPFICNDKTNIIIEVECINHTIMNNNFSIVLFWTLYDNSTNMSPSKSPSPSSSSLHVDANNYINITMIAINAKGVMINAHCVDFINKVKFVHMIHF